MPEYAMTLRTPSKTITFNRPFCLKGVDRWLPPGTILMTMNSSSFVRGPRRARRAQREKLDGG